MRRWEVVGYSTAGWGMRPHVRSRHFTRWGAEVGRMVANQIGLGVGDYEVRRTRGEDA